jgi:DNA modification methylase
MSAGYGGRLLGATACRRVSRYIGTDPCAKTMDGLLEMRDELVPMAKLQGMRTLEVELHRVGSEDFVPQSGSLDLCFTSPPYFDNERYSDEATQSYIKFPTKERWMNGFMRQTLANCHMGLKPHGRLVINIANVPSYPRLEADLVATAESTGWILERTLKLLLSAMPGSRHKETWHKDEPIFVFKKREIHPFDRDAERLEAREEETTKCVPQLI